MKDWAAVRAREGGGAGVRNVFPVQPWKPDHDESHVSIGWSELYNKVLPSCVDSVNDSMRNVLSVILFSMILFQGSDPVAMVALLERKGISIECFWRQTERQTCARCVGVGSSSRQAIGQCLSGTVSQPNKS